MGEESEGATIINDDTVVDKRYLKAIAIKYKNQRELIMNKLKIILFKFFFLFGIGCAYLTFNLSNKNSLGGSYSRYSREMVSSGVDSSNDGVAVGLGIIAGFSFLSSVLLLNSISKK